MDTKVITNSIASLVINKPKDIDAYCIHFDIDHLYIMMSKDWNFADRIIPYSCSIGELEECINNVHDYLIRKYNKEHNNGQQ